MQLLQQLSCFAAAIFAFSHAGAPSPSIDELLEFDRLRNNADSWGTTVYVLAVREAWT